MAGLGWQELMIVLVIIMIVFGAGKLPQVAKSLGQGIKEFRQEASEETPAEGTVQASSEEPSLTDAKAGAVRSEAI